VHPHERDAPSVGAKRGGPGYLSSRKPVDGERDDEAAPAPDASYSDFDEDGPEPFDERADPRAESLREPARAKEKRGGGSEPAKGGVHQRVGPDRAADYEVDEDPGESTRRRARPVRESGEDESRAKAGDEDGEGEVCMRAVIESSSGADLDMACAGGSRCAESAAA
jgi:hypothetical protein